MMVSAENDPRRAGVIWALNLDEPTPVITPLIPTTFRRAGPESASALAEARGGDDSGEILKRFETGRRCYSAWVADKLAAYGWVSFNEEHIGELNLHLTLLPGEAYVWDCATLPAFRQNYLYSALLVHILGELRTESLCRVWIGADFDNVASQRGIARAGFRPVADLLIARVLTLRSVWVQGRPDVPASLVAGARRAFLNNRDKVWLAAVEELGNSR
jgi:ribosomal protein S18 acetylase RimI-like enzyme